MAQTISGGLLTIVCSMEQIIAKLGVEQAGEQVLFFWKVNCLQYIYFLQSTFDDDDVLGEVSCVRGCIMGS